ncbi:LOW QUALITY PROTEIN: hypothetical protein U0070_007346, partial [Myodes glareolus]
IKPLAACVLTVFGGSKSGTDFNLTIHPTGGYSCCKLLLLADYGVNEFWSPKSACAGIMMTQYPSSLAVSVGEKVTIFKFSESILKSKDQKNCLRWFQQKSGQAPKRLIYYESTRGSEIPDRFISSVQAEDQAHYYFACSDIMMTLSPSSLALSAEENVTNSCKFSQSLLFHKLLVLGPADTKASFYTTDLLRIYLKHWGSGSGTDFNISTVQAEYLADYYCQQYNTYPY